jgi:hypothetical protein
MLGFLSTTLPILSWAYRLVVLAVIGFVLVNYAQTSSPTQADGSYVDDLQQALGALKEVARALQ